MRFASVQCGRRSDIGLVSVFAGPDRALGVVGPCTVAGTAAADVAGSDIAVRRSWGFVASSRDRASRLRFQDATCFCRCSCLFAMRQSHCPGRRTSHRRCRPRTAAIGVLCGANE